MAPRTMKQFRQKQLDEEGVVTELPCPRCFVRYPDGEFDCKMPPNNDFWGELGSAVRCQLCLHVGQDCYAPPDWAIPELYRIQQAINDHKRGSVLPTERQLADWEKDEADRVVKETAAYEKLSAEEKKAAEPVEEAQPYPEVKYTPDGLLNIMADIKRRSLRLLAEIQSRSSPYAKNLSGHNGVLAFDIFDPESTSAGSQVEFKGRDRSKAATLRRNKQEERAANALDSDDELATPKKKARYGVKSLGTGPEGSGGRPVREETPEPSPEDVYQDELKAHRARQSRMTSKQKSADTRKVNAERASRGKKKFMAGK